MNAVSHTLLAAWLAENQPNVFNALVRRAGIAEAPQRLEGFTDILKSLGSGISNVAKSVAGGLSSTVKSVGAFLGTKEGAASLTALASTYGAIQLSKVQSQAVQTQASRAAAGLAPAPIEMQWDAARQQYVAVAPNGAALNAGQLSQLAAAPWLPWAMLGGGLILAVLFLRK